MNKAAYRFNSSEMPILADRILSNYKRDKSYFEQYSPKFNQEFLLRFEEKVNSLLDRKSSKIFNDKVIQLNKKIEEFIPNFSPLLNITETFLRSGSKVTNLYVSGFCFTEVKDALNLRSVGEIQRSCLKLVRQLESHIEDFVDKGFIIILLQNFHLLIDKLINLECELAELTHRHDLKSDEYLYIDHQLKDFIETIIESTPAVFGDNDAAKREDYSIEKLMMQTQINRGQTQ